MSLIKEPLTLIAKITFIICIALFIYWISKNAIVDADLQSIFSTDKYEEKCIHGHIILVGHSGGIAGPLGECNE